MGLVDDLKSLLDLLIYNGIYISKEFYKEILNSIQNSVNSKDYPTIRNFLIVQNKEIKYT